MNDNDDALLEGSDFPDPVPCDCGEPPDPDCEYCEGSGMRSPEAA